VCGTIGLIVAFQPGLWIGLFSDDAEVARLGSLHLRIVGPASLSEIDRALAMLGAARWTPRAEPAARWVRPKRDKRTVLFDAATARMAPDKV
jgi:hypothetical protein